MNDDRRTEDEILRWVYRRGSMLRLRAKATRVLSTSLVLAMLSGGMVFALNRSPGDLQPSHEGPPVLADDSPSPKKSETPKPKPTTSPKPKPTTSTSPKPQPTTEPKPATSSEPKPDCFNSFDPACGDFFWKSAPQKNQPLTIAVDVPDAVTGTDTPFAVHVADADAKIWRDAYKIDFGDGTKIMGPADKSCKKGYGPWTLPVRAGDEYDTTFRHTYEAAGTYTVYVHFHSIDRRDGTVPCQQAYGSQNTIAVTVVVTDPPPDPSPSPSI